MNTEGEPGQGDHLVSGGTLAKAGRQLSTKYF